MVHGGCVEQSAGLFQLKCLSAQGCENKRNVSIHVPPILLNWDWFHHARYVTYITFRIYKHHIIWQVWCAEIDPLIWPNLWLNRWSARRQRLQRLLGQNDQYVWVELHHRILLSSFQTLHAVPVEWIKINSNVFLFHYCDLIVFVYFECFQGILNLPARWNMVEDREFMRIANSSMAMYGLNLYTVYVFYCILLFYQ